MTDDPIFQDRWAASTSSDPERADSREFDL
jgi:hypothetical protein